MHSPVPGSIPRATLRQCGFSKREPRGVLDADIDCDRLRPIATDCDGEM